MNVKLILESGLFERRDLRSGRIYRQGSDPEYGVIFTANKENSEDDLGLDKNLMLKASIGRKADPFEDKALFFEILGGYFYHDNYPEPGVTTNVFGIALEPEFGIVEEGTVTLDDNWKLDDPEKPILDESYWSEQYGEHHGWTFIVTLKEREQYPHSDVELKIFAYCPQINQISVEIGDCQFDAAENRLKRNVTFKTLIGEDEVKKWEWHFGDGASDSGAGKPPASIDHLYDTKPAAPPKLCLQGHPACEETCQEIAPAEFDTFVTCPRCPEIKEIIVTLGECKTEAEKRLRKVSFTPVIEGDEPVQWTWDFGDGASESGKGMPPQAMDHFYDKKPSTAPKLCLIGPEPCQENCQEVDLTDFKQCPPCPKIERINHSLADKDETTKTVEFKVDFKDETPDKLQWDWGDGSPAETTTEMQASHDYKIPAEGVTKYSITVTSLGPDDCTDSKTTMIEIPAKKEPVISKLCFFMPLIVAFFMASTVASLLTYNVATLYQKISNYQLLVPVTIVLAVITAVVIFLFYRIRRIKLCPSPVLQDWAGIGWIVLLTGTLISLYLSSYCDAWWWTVIIVFFIAAAFLFIVWLKRWAVELIAVLSHFIACLLAAAFVLYLLLAFRLLM